jgi:hypothetical protein
VSFFVLVSRSLNRSVFGFGAFAFFASGSAYGTRTRAPALRGPCPNRLDERAKQKLPIYRGNAQTQAQRHILCAVKISAERHFFAIDAITTASRII